MDIILASNSKRRRDILKSCGIKHRVIAANVKEVVKGKSPGRIAMFNACLKAEAAALRVKSGCVIGADTLALLGKDIAGKPRDAIHAKHMLKAMSGKAVSVYTGLCVINKKTNEKAVDCEKSIVRVKKIKQDEVDRYFRLLGPYDKAGGFSIEGVGSFIFDNITGSYFNVLGLPMGLLRDMLEQVGVDILTLV